MLSHRSRVASERCLHEMAGTFLEYALWKALTETRLDACCRHDHESVQSYLGLAKTLLSSQAFPIRLPRIGDKPFILVTQTRVAADLV